MMNRVQRLPDWLRFHSRLAAVLTALVTCLLLAPWVAEAQSNSAPVFTDGASATRSFNETIGDVAVETGSNIGAAVVATDTDASDTLTYTLEGTDAARFDIISTSGQLRTQVGEKYDHEAKSSYSVTVRAEDSSVGSDTITVTVNVTDQDEPPAAAPQLSGSGTVSSASWIQLYLSFYPSFNPGRPAITSYEMRYRFGDTGDWTYESWNFWCIKDIALLDYPRFQTRSDLIEDRNWTDRSQNQAQVRAINDEGEGPWSATAGLYGVSYRPVYTTPNTWTTGAPTISGTPQVGETLTADTSGIYDAEGLTGLANPNFTYLWVRIEHICSDRDGVEICRDHYINLGQARGHSYTLRPQDEGKTIQVKVTVVDDRCHRQIHPLTSQPTGTVRPAVDTQQSNTPATGAPTISGTAQVGGMLTAITSAIDDADGLVNASFDYQWQRQDLGTSAETDILGATVATYEVTSDDRDSAVRVSVSFSDDADNKETLTSYWSLVLTPPNHPPTGAPTISGTAQVGGMLTADTSSIADADGLTNVSYEYQWIASKGSSDVEIANATAPTYTVADDDAGWTIQVRVTFTDDADNEQTLTSEATEAVEFAIQPQRANTPATGAPTISGTAQVGGMLTAITSAIDDADGLVNASFTYQWERQDLTTSAETDIPGATGTTYEVTSDDRDGAVRVSVSFSDDAENSETLTSYWLLTMTPPNTPATGVPVISGTAQVGGTLTADTSRIADADGLTNVTYGYQWISSDGTTDTDISGETDAAYTLVADDVGRTIKVRVTFTDDAENETTLTSTATDEVDFAVQQQTANNPATGWPTISGTAQVGEMLTADTSGIADDDGLDNATFRYRWLADDADITGATASTYSLVAADEGKTIKVRVIVTDDAENETTLTSAATAVVAAPEPPAKPAGLSATVVSHDAVALAWDDPQDDAITGYVILRRDREIHPVGTFVTITGDTGSVDTTYTDDTVEPEKEYVYRIKAINEHRGVSEESDWVRADTPAVPVPDKPTGLSAAVSHDTVTLTWDDPQDDSITGYVILRRDREIHLVGTFVTITGDTGSTDTTYTDETVEPDKEYVYRIKAINEYGKVSERSDWVRGFTPAAPQPDSPATGKPTISGTAQVSEELTADTSGIADADGLTNVTYSYQWLGDDTDIAGATSSTYTLVDDDEGQTIKVRVTVTDDAENETTLTSAATEAVAAAPQPDSPATGQPTISGTARVGEMLTADTSGIADDDGLNNVTYSYQWLGDDTDIAGATSSTYTLVADDEGQTIKVRVIVTDDLGNETTLTSAATEAVDAKRNTAATGRPTISGTVRVGETLTADTTGIGDADGLTNVSYSYQWVVTDGGAYIDISGETGATYTLVSADRGLHILVRVSFTDDAGKREKLASAETEVVAAAA